MRLSPSILASSLLAAVVAGPVRVSRPHWLAPIFNGSVPQTRPGTPEQRVVDTLIHRHDAMEDTLRRRPDLYSPVFMNHEGAVISKMCAVMCCCASSV